MIAGKYKKLLSKGDALLSVVLSAPQKAVLVQEASDIIEDFAERVQEVKQLETYLTFDPICDLPEKLEKLKKCEMINLNQATEMAKFSKEVEDLLKKYSSLVIMFIQYYCHHLPLFLFHFIISINR